MVSPLRWGIPIILALLFFKEIAAWAILVDRIAGIIDGEVITYSEVEIERAFKLSDGDDKEILQGLINRRLLLREAERFKIAEGEEDIRKIHQGLEDIKKNTGEERFHDLLEEYNLTDSDILEILKKKTIVEKFIDFRINFFVVISDDAVKAYYNGYKDEFGDRAIEDAYNQIKARLFQLEARRRLDDYLNQLRRKVKISVNL